MKNTNIHLLLLVVLIFALARILPHPWNITPVGALAIFSGAYLDRRVALALPISVLLVSDLFIGMYSAVVMVFVYIGIMLSAIIGRMSLKHKRTLPRIGIAVTGSAFCFYLVSNFGMWLAVYPTNLNGLIQCYINGLPYLVRSLAGDSIYTLLLFGIYEAGRQMLEFNRNNEGRAKI